jgi:hypothetical protein
MKLVSSPIVMSPLRTRKSGHQQHDVDDSGNAVEQRLERAAQPDGSEPGIPQPGSDHGQAIGLAALGTERLDHRDPVEALVHGFTELAELLLRGVIELVDSSLVLQVEPDQQGEQRDRSHAEPHVGVQQPSRREDQHQHDAGREGQRVQYVGRGLGIDTCTGDDVAGSLFAMPRDRLLDNPVDDLRGQRLGDPPRRPAGKHSPADDSGGAHYADGDQQAEDRNDMAGRHAALLEPRHDELVDDETHDDRRENRAGCVDSSTADRGEEQLLVVPEEASDEPECLGRAPCIRRNNRPVALVGPLHVYWFYQSNPSVHAK